MAKKTILIIVIAFLALVGIGGGVYLVQQNQDIQEKATPATAIYLQPDITEAKVGETVTLQVLVDSGENSLATVRLEISFDSSVLEPVEANFSSLLPTTLATMSTSQAGKITGSAGVSLGTSVSGSGQQIATISFKTLSAAPSGTTVSFGSNTLASSATTEDESTNLIIRKTPAKIIISSSSTTTTSPTVTTTPVPTSSTSSNVGIGEEVTPTPTPTTAPTSTPTPTPTPTSSSTSTTTITNTPTPTVISSQENLPVTANLLPTLLLIGGGLLALITFFFVF